MTAPDLYARPRAPAPDWLTEGTPMNQIARIMPASPSLGALIDAAELAYRRNDYRGTDAEIDAKEAAYNQANAALIDRLRAQGLSRSQIAALAVVL